MRIQDKKYEELKVQENITSEDHILEEIFKKLPREECRVVCCSDL